MGLFVKQSEGGRRPCEEFRKFYDFMYVLVASGSNSNFKSNAQKKL